MTDRSHHIIVAGLQFGITQSGYCFSSKNDFESDPQRIYMNQVWNCGTGHKKSLKCPTCVLLDKNKRLDSFGYEAEEKFSDLSMDKKHDEFYFFRGFFTEKVCPLNKIAIIT